MKGAKLVDKQINRLLKDSYDTSEHQTGSLTGTRAASEATKQKNINQAGLGIKIASPFDNRALEPEGGSSQERMTERVQSKSKIDLSLTSFKSCKSEELRKLSCTTKLANYVFQIIYALYETLFVVAQKDVDNRSERTNMSSINPQSLESGLFSQLYNIDQLEQNCIQKVI